MRAPAITAGLCGKLPGYGDFIRRRWPDETVDPLDRWLSATLAAARAMFDDQGFAAWIYAAPLWRGYVPPDRFGPQALHVGVAPSTDRVGRFFAIVAGVAGNPRAVWHHAERAGSVIDAAIRDGVAGRIDADGMVATIATSVDPDGAAKPPPASCWWHGVAIEPLVESEAVDPALLCRLMSMGTA